MTRRRRGPGPQDLRPVYTTINEADAKGRLGGATVSGKRPGWAPPLRSMGAYRAVAAPADTDPVRVHGRLATNPLLVRRHRPNYAGGTTYRLVGR
jgi:hypothetical protein